MDKKKTMPPLAILTEIHDTGTDLQRSITSAYNMVDRLDKPITRLVKTILKSMEEAHEALRHAQGEIVRLEEWKNDLLANKWINCVYCGMRYGPGP